MRIESKSGFTLMELVLVIAILGIIAGMGVGSYANFLRQGSLDSAANEIVATLRKAQTNSQASSDGYAWGVEFNTTTNDQYIFFQGKCSNDGALSCRTPSECGGNACTTNPIETIFLSSSVEINAASFNGVNYTVFDRPTGKPKVNFNGDVIIQLKGGSQQKTINVSALGKIE